MSHYRHQLSACHDEQFVVPYIDQTSCFMTKLLANADRYRMKPHKDIFDLIVMFKSWGMIPQPAFQEAYSHYGEKVINEALVWALEELILNQKAYAQHALDMDIAPSFFTEQIMPAATRLLQSLRA